MSTVRNLLITLKSRGCAETDPAIGHHSLGVRLLEVGQAMRANSEIGTRAAPLLRELARPQL